MSFMNPKDISTGPLTDEDIKAILEQHGERFPVVYSGQLSGFGPMNFLLKAKPKNEQYSVVAAFHDACGFQGEAYVANACNTWPALARELLDLRKQLADAHRVIRFLTPTS
jgi:hypothetical protein